MPIAPSLRHHEDTTREHIGYILYQSFPLMRAKRSSSERSVLGTASGLETHVSLIKSFQVMLWLRLLLPQEPHPRLKVCRIPFHKLPLFEAACGWFTKTRLVSAACARAITYVGFTGKDWGESHERIAKKNRNKTTDSCSLY